MELEGKIIDLKQNEEYREWVTEILKKLPESDAEKIEKKNPHFICPDNVCSFTRPFWVFGEEEGKEYWLIVISPHSLNGKQNFIEAVAHELAHCFYGDGTTPQEIREISFDKPEKLWESIIELRADLQVERWGFELGKETYLYGGEFKEFKGKIEREKALKFAILMDNKKIIEALLKAYP